MSSEAYDANYDKVRFVNYKVYIFLKALNYKTFYFINKYV